MNKKSMISLSLILLCVLTLVTVVEGMWHEKGKGILDKGKEMMEGKIAEVKGEVQLDRPVGYREWVFVGTPVTPNDMNDGKAAFPEFHNVYIDPESYAEYKKSGKFRDGTTLVKELVSVGTKSASSGNGYFQGEFIGLEVAMKDSKKFPKEPGNWGYFSFTNPDKSLKSIASAFPAENCNACHEASAAEDWVFTQYYPVLRAANPMK